MQQTNLFLSILKAEHYKTKRNLGVFLILLFPIAITILIDLYITNEYTESTLLEYNPWTYLLGRYIFQFYSFMYPLLIAILCYSLCDIEYKHNNTKQLFTLPVTKTKLYLAKVVLIIEVILISILLAYFLFMISGYIMSYTMPGYNFQNYDNRIIIAIFFFKIFITSIAIAVIQLFVSLTFNNFTIPIGLACFGIIFSLIANRWKYIDLVPYASMENNLSSFFKGSTELLTKIEYYNLGYIAIFLILSYWCFTNLRRKKS